jgi:hypothetical protein
LALQSLTNSAFSCNGLDVVIFRTIFKIYFLENACNTMCDPSWNEEIGTITQNPRGTADIIFNLGTYIHHGSFFLNIGQIRVLIQTFGTYIHHDGIFF